MSHETAPRDSGDRKEGGLKKQPVERDKVQGANRSKNAREDCASASVQIREKKEKGKVKGKEGKPLEACLLAGGGTYISFRGAGSSTIPY